MVRAEPAAKCACSLRCRYAERYILCAVALSLSPASGQVRDVLQRLDRSDRERKLLLFNCGARPPFECRLTR